MESTIYIVVQEKKVTMTSMVWSEERNYKGDMRMG